MEIERSPEKGNSCGEGGYEENIEEGAKGIQKNIKLHNKSGRRALL